MKLVKETKLEMMNKPNLIRHPSKSQDKGEIEIKGQKKKIPYASKDNEGVEDVTEWYQR